MYKRLTAKLVADIFALALILTQGCFNSSMAQISQPLKHKDCLVYGQVKDPLALALPHQRVIFRREGQTIEVQADESGSYKVRLSIGIYEVIAKLGNGAEYRRAKLAIAQAGELQLNIVAFPTTIIDTFTEEPGATLEFKFQTFPSPSPNDKGLDVVLAYVSRKEQAGVVTYDKATLTYNNYTLYGNCITYNLAAQSFVADGPGTFAEDGYQHYERNPKKLGGITLTFTGPNVTMIVD